MSAGGSPHEIGAANCLASIWAACIRIRLMPTRPLAQVGGGNPPMIAPPPAGIGTTIRRASGAHRCCRVAARSSGCPRPSRTAQPETGRHGSHALIKGTDRTAPARTTTRRSAAARPGSAWRRKQAQFRRDDGVTVHSILLLSISDPGSSRWAPRETLEEADLAAIAARVAPEGAPFDAGQGSRAAAR